MSYNFKSDEIIFNSRAAAEDAMNQIRDLVELYGCVYVSDLKEIAGLSVDYLDSYYVWDFDLAHKAKICRVRDGYIIHMPAPIYYNKRIRNGTETKPNPNYTPPASVKKPTEDPDCSHPIYISIHTKSMDDPAEAIAEVFKYAYTIKDRMVHISIQ